MKKIFIMIGIITSVIQGMDRFDSSIALYDTFTHYINGKGENVLHTLASVQVKGGKDVAETIVGFISRGVDVNLKTLDEQKTPVHYAAMTGKFDLIPVLLKDNQRGLVNEQDKNGDTALHIAARNKCFATVHELLLQNANTSLINNKGKLPIRLIIEDAQYNRPFPRFATKGGLRSWKVTKNLIELFCMFMSCDDIKAELNFAIFNQEIIDNNNKLEYKKSIIDLLQNTIKESNSIRKKDPLKNSAALAKRISQEALKGQKKNINDNKSNIKFLSKFMANDKYYQTETWINNECTATDVKIFDKYGLLDNHLHEKFLTREDLLELRDLQKEKNKNKISIQSKVIPETQQNSPRDLRVNIHVNPFIVDSVIDIHIKCQPYTIVQENSQKERTTISSQNNTQDYQNNIQELKWTSVDFENGVMQAHEQKKKTKEIIWNPIVFDDNGVPIEEGRPAKRFRFKY